MKLWFVLSVSLLLGFGLISFAQDHSSQGQHQMDVAEDLDVVSEANPVEEDLGICPVMGGQAKEEYSYVYEGKTYYFCCPPCIEKFKSNPQEYISKEEKVGD